MRAAYRLTIDGKDVSNNFAPVLISLSINDSDGGKSDTLDIELDDHNGQIELPRAGAKIVADLWWSAPPPWAGAGAVHFEGVTDEPESSGARGGGMTLSISAKSADHAGKGKEKSTRHKDDSTFEEAAKEFAESSGHAVKIEASLGAVRRDYWSMSNESFFSWGARIANELGATFKISGGMAVFVPRNGDTSASGKALGVLTVARGRNLINWRLSPSLGRSKYRRAVVRRYDWAEAKWKTEEKEIDSEADSDLVETMKSADSGRAKSRADNNAADAERGKGGGSVTIDGDPAAMSQAPCIVSGVRPGIDGTYRIKSARHTYRRGGGWTTSCDLEQPQGDAGKDSRKPKAE